MKKTLCKLVAVLMTSTMLFGTAHAETAKEKATQTFEKNYHN